jgi:pyruvate dehydrogenase E2 component (dihydrolipoamide acetyltransferase)
MPFTLTMPKLSPTMEAGVITKWQKAVGDEVKPGDVLFEVATDKATVEYNALDGGVLRSILVKMGQEVKVGEVVAVFAATKEEDISSYIPEPVVVEVEKEKPSRDLVCEKESVLPTERPSQRPSPSIMQQQPIFSPEPPIENYQFPFSHDACGERIASTPYARKKAKELGIDLATVKGSGPRQRIVSKDLPLGQQAGCYVFGKKEVPTMQPGTYEEEALSPMRKVISSRLQQSKSSIPHFYVMQEVDASPMAALKDQLKAFEVKITFNDMIIKALALTLKKHPVINSGFDSATNSIIRFKTIDISVAVSVSSGLITPIVRHADYKNLGQINREVKNLADKAKLGKLSREEYVGGSFTLSNLGMFGISGFMGILNPPQAGILSVGGVEDKPVVRNGQVVPGKVMTLALSADHRVIDGSDAAIFMKDLQKLLENPSLLLM